MSTPSPDPDATARADSGVPSTPRSVAQAQFAPGTVIANRYRIAGILGSGGMGEVYRADDIKLDQAVALKFLPARLARDPILLARLHDEVRLGRQVAHPNVCRIYDIVDWQGAQFVAMEFVDGEDLSRLLRRIGRLAHDKAVDIARGIAAGLSAAHAKGILHRDLKPANVMIDSRGDSRIMDFGLALAAGEDDGTISGTPAYMAPEQLEGVPATIQSDLYALGLVMYELFTGKRAHNARTMPERVREISTEITLPSSVIRDMDPAVERIILRCLSDDPSQRPRSAREVIESLPGGDPLAAALAAGETPSPGMVAAAGTEGSLTRVAAWSMLAAIAVIFVAYLFVRRDRAIANYIPQPRSPEVLRDGAEQLLRQFGIAARGTPVAGFRRHDRYTAWLGTRDLGLLRRGPAPFVYGLRYGVGYDEAATLPAMTAGPGLASIDVDPHGRLTFLLAAPPSHSAQRTLDANAILRAAGLDPAAMKPVQSGFTPPVAFDRFEAWAGTYPGDPTPIRAELASWRGTPTFFRITGEWDEGAEPEFAFETRAVAVYLWLMAVALFAAAGLLAWRNLKLRRGDRRGAWRLAVLMFATQLIAQLLRRGVSDDLLETFELLVLSTGLALFISGASYVLYIAIEPLVRRRWPRQLISWARLMEGRWRDPLTGFHVLVGIIGGLAHALIATSDTWLIANVDRREVPLNISGVERLSGMQMSLAVIADAIGSGIMQAVPLMAILVLLTVILRKRGLAVAGLFIIVLAAFMFATGGDLAMMPFTALIAGILTLLLTRFGVLPLAVMQSVFAATFFIPPMGTSWAAPMVALPFIAVALLTVWAFFTSLGGQSPFAASLLDE